jgi:NADPH:quinone reductase-like Zn-dependent oxidoreductase
MKSAEFKRYGGSDVIEINQTTPTPTLTAGNGLVEIKAAGINLGWKYAKAICNK